MYVPSVLCVCEIGSTKNRLRLYIIYPKNGQTVCIVTNSACAKSVVKKSRPTILLCTPKMKGKISWREKITPKNRRQISAAGKITPKMTLQISGRGRYTPKMTGTIFGDAESVGKPTPTILLCTPKMIENFRSRQVEREEVQILLLGHAGDRPEKMFLRFRKFSLFRQFVPGPRVPVGRTGLRELFQRDPVVSDREIGRAQRSPFALTVHHGEGPDTKPVRSKNLPARLQQAPV